jgi:pimeloyl-ACP methyl ester carboxylesterase
VLLVPGRGDSSDLFPTLLSDRLVGAGLSVIRCDPRDTGLSGGGGDTYTMATMAEDAVAVLDAAGAAAVHVVAVSMGGLIATHLATRHADRVASLTLVSAMSPDPDAGMGEDFFAGLDGDPLELRIGAMGAADEEDRLWVADELALAAARAPDRPDAAVLHQEAAFRMEWPTLDALAAVTVPVQVVHGEVDRVLPVAHAEAFGRGVAGATVVVRPGMGHLPRPQDWAVVADLVVGAARPS